MTMSFLAIEIGIDPNMFEFGPFLLTWHGFFTFVAVALAVYLVGRWGKQEGMNADAIYSVAVWAIIAGVIGARLVHVIDYWDEFYRHDMIRVIQVWSGGIAIYGAIIGGFIGGAGYISIRNNGKFLNGWNKVFPWAKLDKAPLPSIGRLADIAAPALLISQTVGRFGDIINGEHVAKLTDLSWGFVYTHASSATNQMHGLAATHPAIAYEMIWNLVALGVIWALRRRLRPHGMLFVAYGAVYSIGRFFISFLRSGPPPMDEQYWGTGLNEAQLIALMVLAIAVPLLVYKAQFVKPEIPTRTKKVNKPAKT